MSLLIKNILNAGLHEDLPVQLQRKVIPTNIICLILIFVIAIPFIIISLFYFPILALIPGMGGLTCIAVIISNQLGGIKHSRLILSILPLLLAASYNAFLCDAGDEPISSVFLTELSFSLIPFVIFDLEEKKFLIGTSLLCALVIITFPITKLWVEVEADASVLRFGWLSNLTVFLAVLTGFGCMSGLAFLNKQSEKMIEQSMQEMNEKNKFLQESETKLKDNLQKIEEAQLNEKKRNWASEGITNITRILQSYKDKQQLADKLIAEMVIYVKASQGGLYIVEENKSVEANEIRLASFYAFSRKKFIEQSYKPGQGLIGQAYLEKEYIHLTEVPADYIRITSGLGEASPRAILVMPLKINDMVEGIIEIASFSAFESYQIDFIKKAGETIAAYIQNNRINENTSALLEDFRQQTEEMRAQEEEMRQNMEELEATQEEMRRNENTHLQQLAHVKQVYQTNIASLQEKDREMNSFITAVDATLALIEFDLEGNVLTANQRFLDIVGYTLDEIAGKPHRSFLQSVEGSADAYPSFWQQILTGKVLTGEVVCKTNKGKEICLIANYAPVFGENGQLQRIISFTYDISLKNRLA